MTEYLKQMRGFNFVSANSLCSKFLEESLVRGGSTDTDEDGLTDSQEVDWNCIDVIMNGKEYTSEDGIVIALPTFEQVLGFSNFYDAKTYDRISPYYRKAIGNINILPVKSDPTMEDSDEDWIKDSADPTSFRGDVNDMTSNFNSEQLEELQNWLVSIGYLNMLDNDYGVSYGVLTNNAVNIYRLNHGIELTEEKKLDSKTYALIANDYFNKYGNGKDEYSSKFSYLATPYSDSISVSKPTLNQDYINNGITVSLEDNKTIKSDVNKNGEKVPKINLYFYDYTIPVREVLVNKVFDTLNQTNEYNNLRKMIWFYSMVNHGAEWDIKLENRWNQIFPGIKYYAQKFPFTCLGCVMNSENLGNVTYGYWGSAIGLSEQILYDGSSFAAFTGGTKDTSEDKEFIKLGVDCFFIDFEVEYAMQNKM